jgi:cytochrome P450
LADLDSHHHGDDEKNKHQDLLSYLMIPDDQGQRLSYQYLFGNTRMFLFAGHDTTAAILSDAFWKLATHPQIQARLQAELDPLFDTTESSPNIQEFDATQVLGCSSEGSLASSCFCRRCTTGQ